MSSHSLLACKISVEKSESLAGIPWYVTSLFSLSIFKIYSLTSDNLIMMCLYAALLRLYLFEILWTSSMASIPCPTFGTVLGIIALNTVHVLSCFSSNSRIPQNEILFPFIVSHTFIGFLHSFSFYSSDWIIPFVLSPRSLNLLLFT